MRRRWSISTRRRVIAGVLVALVFAGPQVGDAVAGMLARTDGCRLTSVVDGDTAWMFCPGSGFQSTRLVGFDTPEIGGDCLGERMRALGATWALRLAFWRAGEVSVREMGEDRYGRRLASVSVDGVPLADHMVEAGWARPYAGGQRQGWCG